MPKGKSNLILKKIYYISYDSTDGFENFESKFKTIGPWFSYFDGQWLIESSKTKEEIYSLIQDDNNPKRLLILEINIKDYWGWMPNDAWEWLKSKKQ